MRDFVGASKNYEETIDFLKKSILKYCVHRYDKERVREIKYIIHRSLK
jgi:hypothetical protein